MLVDRFDAFLIDLDGTVYVDGELLPDAREALAALRRRRIPLRFITNDPRPTRAELVGRLHRMGVWAAVDEVVSSGWATARWLRTQGVTRVYALGSDGLRQELAAQGLDVGGNGDVDAVVVGCDDNLSYRDLGRATELIGSGAQFVATNAEATFPAAGGRWPATGAVVAAVAVASGRQPVVIGKPGPEIFRLAMDGLPSEAKVAVVGDTVATDVIGAHRAGLSAILVDTSGQAEVHRAHARESAPSAPEAVVEGLAGLFDPGVEARIHQPMSFPWPDDVRAGVAALVFDEAARVLLGRRMDNGLWGLPSGRVEIGETVAQAAVREVAEETGLRVTVDRLVGVYSDPASQVFTYPDGRAIQFITTSFACSPVGGELRADGRETDEVAFFPIDRLPTPLLPMHPRWLSDALSGRTGLIDL